jgi:hypothetical protein
MPHSQLDRSCLRIRRLNVRPNQVKIERDAVFPEGEPRPISSAASEALTECVAKFREARAHEIGNRTVNHLSIALNTPGNSANVCWAAEVARAKSFLVLTSVRSLGRKFKALANVCICVPATQTPHIQEIRLPIYHCFPLMLEEALLAYWQ